LTFVQALQAAGKNLTRAALISAIEGSGKKFVTPGFVPLSYSSSVHYGFHGLEAVKLSTTAPPAVTPSGSRIGGIAVSPVETTNVGSGPVAKCTGRTSTPPAKLASTS